MTGQLKKLFGDAAIYGVSSIFGRAINFLLVPIYTSVFLPGEYGVVTELYAYVAFLMVVYLFGIETTYFRFATKYEDTRRYYNLSISILLVTSLLFSGLFIAFSDPIADYLEYENASQYVVWLAIVLALDTLVAVPFARLRLQRKAKKFALFKISNILVNIGWNLFFVVFAPQWQLQVPNLGVGYVFVSNLTASVFTLLLFLPDLVRFQPLVDKQRGREMINYATPLVIIGLAGVTNEMLSRAMLRHWLPEGFYEGFTNAAILGIFGACYKLSMLMNLSVQSFRYAYEPFFFSKSADRKSPELFARVMNAFIIYGCLAFMVISIILPETAHLVLRQQDYLLAIDIVPMLLFGGFLLGIFYNLSVWYKLTDKTYYGAVVTIIGALLTFFLNWLLIPMLGYHGSAIATLSVYLIMVVISFCWGQKHFFVPYQVGKGVSYLLYSYGFVWMLYFFQFDLTTKYLVSGGALLFFLLLTLIFEKPRKTAP